MTPKTPYVMAYSAYLPEYSPRNIEYTRCVGKSWHMQRQYLHKYIACMAAPRGHPLSGCEWSKGYEEVDIPPKIITLIIKVVIFGGMSTAIIMYLYEHSTNYNLSYVRL